MNTWTRHAESRYRARPDIVRLPASGGAKSSDKAPVRIFLGTEDGQWRAERVFIYAIEQVRDPTRDYEIHVMKNLAGFDRRRWRTGFTNYRFAVPELAGGAGRAIYNDVDQIYLTDPAALFDLPLDGRGYLAVSSQDTSVMLMDCSAMSAFWNLDRARTQTKAQLLHTVKDSPELWGELDGRWNARDMEFPREEIRLLHYTALHLQPWRPFPERYSYHDHPMGDLWFDLERRADSSYYQPYTRCQPSALFDACRSQRGAASALNTESLLRFAARLGAASVMAITGSRPDPVRCRPEAAPALKWAACDELREDGCKQDVVAVAGLSELVPGEDVPWMLDALFGRARVGVHLTVKGIEKAGEDEVDVRRALRTTNWWKEQVTRAARRYPGITWQLEVTTGSGLRTFVSEAPSRKPSVWLLEGHRMGDALQLCRIADALGWPYRKIRLRYNPLHMLPGFVLGASIASLRNPEVLTGPWPDVVIASGKRSSPAAQWIRQQSGGQTRIVSVGRPWSRLDAFDLIVTTPQYRLPVRSNTLHLSLPIASRTAADFIEAGRCGDLPELPRPRIAVLVGGNSTSCALSVKAAAALGKSASELAAGRGGSLLVSGSPRTPRKAFEALCRAIEVPSYSWQFGQTDRTNPYVQMLASADEVLVTGDSVSMLADALASGRPVRVFPLPPSPLARLVGFLRAPIVWLAGHRKTYRGTPRQQGPIGRWYDRLIDRGILTPPRDLEYLQDVLSRRGLINGGRVRRDQGCLAEQELTLVVERIRNLLRQGEEVESP